MNIQRSGPQNDPSKLIQDAKAAWKRWDYQRSIELLERASQLSPNDPCILLDLGRVHGARYNYVAAESCFEKALGITAWRSPAFVAAGLHCLAFGRPQMAERYLQRTLKRNGDSVDALVQLAGIYERHNRPDAAAELVDRALRLDANNAPALLTRAILDRHAGRLAQAEKLLRSFVSRPTTDVWIHAHSWYELGGVLDCLGRYDEAMAAVLEAKVLMKPTAQRKVPGLKKSQAHVKKNAETISTSDLQRWCDSGNLNQPVRQFAVLCGHPRSGTTLLEQVLDSHPDIVSAEETAVLRKEAYFPLTRDFNTEVDSMSQILDAATPDLLRKSREEYFRLIEAFLGQPVGDRLLIDKNPSLTIFIPAIIRIFPEAKILVVIRDPRDVCLSCFMQPIPPAGASVAYASLDGTVTEYTSVMGFWRAIAPRLKNPYIEVRYEDMLNDLESAARRVTDFLGLPWDGHVLNFDQHARQKAVRSPTYAEVRKPVFKTAMGRWRNYQKYLEPHLERLEPFVKAFNYE